jgi:solute carrier family 25, member 39/40
MASRPKENELVNNSSHRSNPLFQRVLSAGIGAFITSLVVTPFDVVKVRMQAKPQTNSQSLFEHIDPCAVCSTKQAKPLTNNGCNLKNGKITSTLEGISAIRRHEGILSLYRGFLPTLVMSIPATVIYFVGYETLKERFDRQSIPYSPLLSGMSARILAVAAISPLELLRTRMQYIGAAGGSIPQVSRDLFSLVKLQGGKVLWRGLIPTICRDVPFSGIYWTCIESIRPRFRKLFGGNKKVPSKPLNNHSNRTHVSLGLGRELLVNFGAGALSGGVAAALTVPFDVAKTRYQISNNSQHISLSHTLLNIWKEEGMRGLTAGIVPRMIKVAPACAIMITSYEIGKLLL